MQLWIEVAAIIVGMGIRRAIIDSESRQDGCT
jgi:hypothetical protein